MSKLSAFLNRHKTKITGLLIAVLGQVQASAVHLGTILSAKEFAQLMFWCGLLVTVLGFLNSRKP